MSEDPIHFDSGDYNLYRYVENKPVNRTDPSGLLSFGQIIGGAVGVAVAFQVFRTCERKGEEDAQNANSSNPNTELERCRARQAAYDRQCEGSPILQPDSCRTGRPVCN